MRVGLATIQYGRQLQLARQARAVTRLEALDRYVIVSMEPEPPRVPGAEVVHRPAVDDQALPLAAARNAAIGELSDMDLVVILDIDCIPDPRILDGYRNAIETIGSRHALLAGPVGYLDALAPCQLELSPEDRRRARSNVKREHSQAGVRREPRVELFWSLSYAVCPDAHYRIGGFDEGYVGYGAEDTDYAFRARERGADLWDVADAWAYHQPHPPASDDPSAVAAIAANINRFHRTWGIWPMPGWIQRSVARGDVKWTSDGTLAPWPRAPVPSPLRRPRADD
jgi:N-acetylglucosaminyl-diphospho-decaprenol L-rhamnosyltransferase